MPWSGTHVITFGVANDVDGVLCPGEGNVEPPGVGEKADAKVLVGAHAGDDNVLIAALEGVHAHRLDVLVKGYMP